MKPDSDSRPDAPEPPLTTELLLLPDGRILVHNLTPAFAELLGGLNPGDGQIASRIIPHPSSVAVLRRVDAARSHEFPD